MSKTDLSKFNNDWYKPGAGALKRFFWYHTNAVFFKSSFPINGVKLFLLKLYGAKVGSGVVIKPGVNIKYPWNLTIANRVWIGENVWIDNLDKVEIANNVCVSQGAMLLTGNHNYKKQTFDLQIGKIILEDGVWIGAKAMVCPGVTCKSHSVLAVMSAATSDLDSYAVYQGNPAKKIRDRKIEA